MGRRGAMQGNEWDPRGFAYFNQGMGDVAESMDKRDYNTAMATMDSGQEVRPDNVQAGVWNKAMLDRAALQSKKLANQSQDFALQESKRKADIEARKDRMALAVMKTTINRDPSALAEEVNKLDTRYEHSFEPTGRRDYFRAFITDRATGERRTFNPFMDDREELHLAEIAEAFSAPEIGGVKGAGQRITALQNMGKIDPATYSQNHAKEWTAKDNLGREQVVPESQVPLAMRAKQGEKTVQINTGTSTETGTIDATGKYTRQSEIGHSEFVHAPNSQGTEFAVHDRNGLRGRTTVVDETKSAKGGKGKGSGGGEADEFKDDKEAFARAERMASVTDQDGNIVKNDPDLARQIYQAGKVIAKKNGTTSSEGVAEAQRRISSAAKTAKQLTAKERAKNPSFEDDLKAKGQTVEDYEDDLAAKIYEREMQADDARKPGAQGGGTKKDAFAEPPEGTPKPTPPGNPKPDPREKQLISSRQSDIEREALTRPAPRPAMMPTAYDARTLSPQEQESRDAANKPLVSLFRKMRQSFEQKPTAPAEAMPAMRAH